MKQELLRYLRVLILNLANGKIHMLAPYHKHKILILVRALVKALKIKDCFGAKVKVDLI